MSSEELENKYKDLEDHLLELLIRYIAPHSDSLQKPEEYNLDVHSFCILCHAAFEEFLEDVTLFSIENIERQFKNKPRRFSYATLCLLHFDEQSKNIGDENSWPAVFNDYLLERISARKKRIEQICNARKSWHRYQIS